MLVVVVAVRRVPMAVMDVIHMVVVLNHAVTAPVAMYMVMFGGFVGAVRQVGHRCPVCRGEG